MTDRLTHSWFALTAPVVMAAALCCAPPARADSDHDRAYLLKQAGEIVPLMQILDDATRERQGTVLEIEMKGDLEEEGEGGRGRIIYEVEILDAEGVVWKLFYDAHTGRRISEEPEKE